ncbi:MAG: glycosyltransferase family A protein [Bacteroidota bacterium]
MSHAIRITVLMPAYNSEKYIGMAIQSVLDQSFTDFELLIVNDGSADDTEAVIRSFTDERIVLVNQVNGGVSVALNTGLQMARGKYIVRFDSDDICYADRLAVQFAFMEANSDHVLTGSDVDYVTEEGDFIYHHHCFAYGAEELSAKLYFYCPFIHSAVMYRKDAVMKLGGYDTRAHTFEDYFLWVHLFAEGKMANLPRSLIKVRLNPASVTIDEKWRGRKFRKLKKKIILKASISQKEEDALLRILQEQDRHRVKHGAYYALVGKKYLVNNYKPQKARAYIRKAISIHPYRPDLYALYLLSFLSKKMIDLLHSFSLNRL